MQYILNETTQIINNLFNETNMVLHNKNKQAMYE